MEVLRGYQTEILLALCTLVLFQFVVIVSLSGRVNRLGRSFRTLLTGPTGEDLESLIGRSLEESRKATAHSAEVDARLDALHEEMRGCFQHIGLVRYDAFHDVSGHQSFSLAMLDGNLNGTVITGLFGRQDSRCFGKSVIEGRTAQPLSGEEENALMMAINGGLSAYLNGHKNGTHPKKPKKSRPERDEDDAD